MQSQPRFCFICRCSVRGLTNYGLFRQNSGGVEWGVHEADAERFVKEAQRKEDGKNWVAGDGAVINDETTPTTISTQENRSRVLFGVVTMKAMRADFRFSTWCPLVWCSMSNVQDRRPSECPSRVTTKRKKKGPLESTVE